MYRRLFIASCVAFVVVAFLSEGDTPGGFEMCINEYLGFSPLQLYEQKIFTFQDSKESYLTIYLILKRQKNEALTLVCK